MAYIKNLPQVHFGQVDEKKVDWRKNVNDTEEDEATSEISPELLKTMLGFDPKDIFPDIESKSKIGLQKALNIN